MTWSSLLLPCSNWQHLSKENLLPKREQKPEYKTPVGELQFPWLNKPQTEINGAPCKPAWTAPMVFTANDEQWIDTKTVINALVEDSYAAAVAAKPAKKKLIERAYPYQMMTDEDGEETGKVKLKLKQNYSYINKKTGEEVFIYPDLIDRYGKRLDRTKTLIFSGSTAVAVFTSRPYFMESTNKAGISLDLKAVQIKNLVTAGGGRSAASYGFDIDEMEDEDEAVESNTPESDDPTDF